MKKLLAKVYENLWNGYAKKLNKKFGQSSLYGGFYLDPIDLKKLIDVFDISQDIKIDLSNKKYYENTKLSATALETLNDNNKYKEGRNFLEIVKTFLISNDKSIKNCIKSNYRVVNIRAWKMLPSKRSFGPSDFHKDGLRPAHMKIMIYLSPLNLEYGTLQFLDQPPLVKDAGYVLVFQNSDIVHRAIPGDKYPRKLIELTVQKTFKDFHSAPKTGNCNDRNLKLPVLVYLK